MKQFYKYLSAAILFGLLLFLNNCNGDNSTRSVVLFDQAHGQRFLTDKMGPLQLSKLAKIFEAQKNEVRINKQPLTEKSLSSSKILVISGPFLPISPEEIVTITKFLNNGGRLCVMLHIASPAAKLLQALGVAISNGVIYDEAHCINNNPLDFTITRLAPHEINKGLKSFNVYGSWALMNTKDNTRLIAMTSPKSWVDLNKDRKLTRGDAVQSFGVIASGEYGTGRFVVFGDDAIFQNQFLENDNVDLGENLVRWLTEESTNNKM